MPKKSRKTQRTAHKKDYLIGIVAEMKGVTPRYVAMVRDGQCQNEDIFTAYMELRQGTNALIEEVKRITPFDPKSLDR